MLAQSLTAHSNVPRGARRRSPAIKHAHVAVLLPLPVRRSRTRRCGVRVRAGHRGADPDDDDRPDRRHSSPSRSRASAASSRRRRSTSRSRSTSSASTAACSSATRCRPASAAPAARWWGIEHEGVEPDIMTMAKGIANGMPIGGTIATPAIADSWKALHHLHLRRQPDLGGRGERDDRRHRGAEPR